MKTHNKLTKSKVVFDLGWRKELQRSPLTKGITDYYAANLERIAELMLEASSREVAALGGAPGAALKRVLEHCKQHTQVIHNVMRLGFDLKMADFSFVRENARIRASESFPLAALLHAYRVGHRVTWEILSGLVAKTNKSVSAEAWRTVMAFSQFTMEYTNLISNIAAEAYTEERRLMERVIHRERAAVLEGLLRQTVDPRVVIAAEAMGLNPDGSLVVFGARLPEGHTEGAGDQLLNAASRLEVLLRPHCQASLLDVRQSEIVGVLQGVPAFAKRLQVLLSDSARKWMGESSFLVGISSDRRGLSAAWLCYDDVQQALHHVALQTPIVRFDAIPLFDHLIATADQAAYRIRPFWLEGLLEEDRRLGGVLLETVEAYLNTHMSAKEAAAALGVHTNTIYHRLKRVNEVAGQRVNDTGSLLNLVAALSLHRGR